MVFSDRDGIVRLWNRAAEGIFGYTEAEAVGQPLDRFLPRRQHEAHRKGPGEPMLDGATEYGSETLTVPAATRDGERISIEFTIHPLLDADRRMLGQAAVIRDVTARWNRERSLREKLAFLEAGRPAA